MKMEELLGLSCLYGNPIRRNEVMFVKPLKMWGQRGNICRDRESRRFNIVLVGVD